MDIRAPRLTRPPPPLLPDRLPVIVDTAWMLAMSVTTLSSCLFYIVGTYVGRKWWVLKVEITFGCFFVVDYFLSLMAAPVRRNMYRNQKGFSSSWSIVQFDKKMQT